MGIVEERLKAIGIEIDRVDRTGCGKLPCRRYKDLLFMSAQGPFDKDGNPLMQGVVGEDYTGEEGYEAGRLTAVRMLAALKDAIGDLDNIDYFVKALCIFNAGGEFYDMPRQAQGFSYVMTQAFGQRGRHARAAMGCGPLPRNTPFTAELIVKLKD